ncbi:hypothetical protein ACFQT0_28115 [Hymenobacter humi]|uniref:Uncharacterized protein n=1 Tax=Hymenobacter humi TaxID=1411620 RepID=A0ABW2UBA4_9BACT
MGVYQAQGLLVAVKAFLLLNFRAHFQEDGPGQRHSEQQQPPQAPVGG